MSKRNPPHSSLILKDWAEGTALLPSPSTALRRSRLSLCGRQPHTRRLIGCSQSPDPASQWGGGAAAGHPGRWLCAFPPTAVLWGLRRGVGRRRAGPRAFSTALPRGQRPELQPGTAEPRGLSWVKIPLASVHFAKERVSNLIHRMVCSP